MKKCICAILPFFLTAFLTGCITFSQTDSDTEGDMAYESPISSNQQYEVGEVASSGNLNIKITDWKAMNSIDSGIGIYTPDRGNIYLVVFTEFENISSQSQTIRNYSDIEFYVDDYEAENAYFDSSIEGVSGYTWSDSMEIKPGKKSRGYYAIEVPENWERVEFIYGEDISIQITNEDYVESKDIDFNEKTEYKVGEIASSGDIGICVTNWRSVNRVDDGYRYYSPDSGNEIYLIFIELQNNSDSECSVRILNDVTFYMDDYECEMVGLGYSPPTIDGKPALNKAGFNDPIKIKPERKVSGYLSLQAPPTWGTFELVFQDDIVIDLANETSSEDGGDLPVNYNGEWNVEAYITSTGTTMGNPAPKAEFSIYDNYRVVYEVVSGFPDKTIDLNFLMYWPDGVIYTELMEDLPVGHSGYVTWHYENPEVLSPTGDAKIVIQNAATGEVYGEYPFTIS